MIQPLQLAVEYWELKETLRDTGAKDFKYTHTEYFFFYYLLFYLLMVLLYSNAST